MSAEFTRPEPTFAPVPTWDRSSKRARGLFSSGKSPRKDASIAVSEARPFTTDAPPAARDTFIAAPATEVESVASDSRGLNGGAPFAGAPTYARTTQRASQKSGASGLAIAAGVVAVGAIAVGGWYAMQPRERGVATLTPGAASSTSVMADAAPLQPQSRSAESPPGTLAQNTAEMTVPATPPSVERAAMPRAEAAPVRTARVRPAQAAGDLGMDATATLPAAPIPYATGSAAPAGVTSPTSALPTPAPLAVPPAAAAVSPTVPAATNPLVTPAPTSDGNATAP